MGRKAIKTKAACAVTKEDAAEASLNRFTTEGFVKMCEQEHWIKQQFPLDRPHNDSQRRRIKRQRQRFREHLGLEEPPENRVRWLDEARAHRVAAGVTWFLPDFHSVHELWPSCEGAPIATPLEMIAEMLQWCDELRRRWEGYIAKTLRDYGVPVDLLRHAVASQQWETVASLAQAGRAAAADVLHFLWADAPDAASQRTLAKLRASVARGDKATSPPVVKALRVYEEMVRVYQGELEGAEEFETDSVVDVDADSTTYSDAYSRGLSDVASLPRSPLETPQPIGSCRQETYGDDEDWRDVNDDGLLRLLSIDHSSL
eukprot:TRINITY_DN2305_c0_g2_i2.p1 TRINITY_DN2305_c0_g2~~TRINITY_DN2305_c0_g2_i2.p1  ORF type:complete len:316 (+),score=115.58 TRINITY_DN2305_c0_g2_i2:63-1010(+)